MLINGTLSVIQDTAFLLRSTQDVLIAKGAAATERKPQDLTNILARFLGEKILVYADNNQCSLGYCQVVYEGTVVS
jgi:hypothetical protein